MPHLIAFDLDGTLVDSRRDLADSANELLADYGAPPLSIEAVTRMVGDGARVLVQRALRASGLEPDQPQALDRFLAIYERRLTLHTRLYPHVRDALDAIRDRAALALLTNKPGPHTRKLLDALDLTPYFTAGIIGGNEGWPRKPEPAGLRHLISAAGTDAAHTLMVGDSMTDVDTARRADTRCCIARYGFGDIAPNALADPAMLIADTPADLQTRLEDFVAGKKG